MGLFDLPVPLFARVDAWLGGALPPLARLCLWAALGALVSMELYRLLSPQQRIAGLKDDIRLVEARLAAFDGEFAAAWPLVRRMLALALRRIAAVLPATLIASAPLLALIVWLDTAYGRAFPEPGIHAAVTVEEPYRGQLVAAPPQSLPRAEVLDGRGAVVAEVELQAPVPVVHKKRWWNVLVGNPAGYLDSAAPVDRIGLDLPRRQFLEAGPQWLRGWEFAFFAVLVAASLIFKLVRRIQ